MGLFKPAWKSNNFNKAIKAVKKETEAAVWISAALSSYIHQFFLRIGYFFNYSTTLIMYKRVVLYWNLFFFCKPY